MRTLSIDFAPRTTCRAWHRARPFARLALLLGVAAAGAELLAVQRGLAAIAGAEAVRGRALAANAPRGLSADAGPAPVGAKRAESVNTAIARLNLPWAGLFAAVEAATPDDVAVLSMVPDAKGGLVRLVAEAGGSDDMLRYVERLKAQPALAEVVLVHHEVDGNDPNQPLRFTIDARWRRSGP